MAQPIAVSYNLQEGLENYAHQNAPAIKKVKTNGKAGRLDSKRLDISERKGTE